MLLRQCNTQQHSEHYAANPLKKVRIFKGDEQILLEVLRTCNNYRSRNLIGRFPTIFGINTTLITLLFIYHVHVYVAVLDRN